jgi:hypothetical protein
MSIDIVGMVPCVVTGYLLTVAVETAVLFVGLQRKYSWKQKLAAGFILTGISYPFVCFVFPRLFPPFIPNSLYLWVAEIFAPVSECLAFWLLFNKREWHRSVWRNMATIVAANLTSFLFGELLKHTHVINFVWYPV